MTFSDRFQWAITNPSDIGEHVPVMVDYAFQCSRITEFGVRGGVSTTAWIKAHPIFLTCYDLNTPENLPDFTTWCLERDIQFHFSQADTRLVFIEPTDLLFIDTLHNAETLSAELTNNHAQVSKYIILHDTEFNAWQGENGGKGLRVALIDFLLANPQWRIEKHYTNCNGLTVLRRA